MAANNLNVVNKKSLRSCRLFLQSLADQLGLKSVNAIGVNTANGDSVGYMVRLKSVKIGGIEEQNVSAMIAPNLEGDVLLGMSFLGRLDVRLFKGEMTLKQITD